MKRSKELENAIADLLDLKGLKYMRVTNYRCFKCGQIQNAKAKGFPDFFCYHPALAIEAKTGTGHLTKEQKKIKELLQESNIPYLVIRDIQDLITYLEYGKWWRGEKKNKRRLRKILV